MRITSFALVSLCLAPGLHAAGFAGTWEALVPSPEGEFKMTYQLASTPDAWSGNLVVGEFGTFPMADLKIKGDTISFKVASDYGEWKHRGTLKDDVLNVVVTGPDGELPPVVLKHAAAAIDGKWRGTVATPDGDLPLAFTFRHEGEKLAGSVESQFGVAPFLAASVNGDVVTWETEFEGMKIQHSGKLSGDTMAVEVTSPDWAFTVVLTRDGPVSEASAGRQ